ncbi:MAG: baseplate J/gp47 family protein [bacterium]
MNNLPEPNFIDRDANKITQEWIALYEEKTGKTLYPAQVERIIIDVGVYRENLLRIGIQEAAKQNLVNFATFPMLDYLGELVGVERLKAQKAKTKIKASITETKDYDIEIPAGTVIDGKTGFSLLENLVIKSGSLFSDEVSAECLEAGIIGNGYLSLNSETDGVKLENTVITAGGADEEDDDTYRLRIKQAPEKYSNAGSKGAYEFLTKSAHQDIIDVAVISPQLPATVSYKVNGVSYSVTADKNNTFTGAKISSGSIDYINGKATLAFSENVSNIEVTIPPAGTVEIYPLARNPTPAILDMVKSALNDETKRPLTDNVIIKSPQEVSYGINAEVTLFSWADSIIVKAEINSILNNYVQTLKSKLAQDIVPAKISSLILSVNGVYNANLISPSYKALAPYEWANCTSVVINV